MLFGYPLIMPFLTAADTLLLAHEEIWVLSIKVISSGAEVSFPALTAITAICSPVSYTHLDVYKRQDMYRFGRGESAAVSKR